MKKTTSRIFDWLALAAILLGVLFAFTSGAASGSQAMVEANDAIRIEIQRYMGYEVLPVRYLSLPYDMTMSVNEQLALLDIGFLILAICPLILLFSFRKKPLVQWTLMGVFLFILVISAGTGYIVGPNMEQLPNSADVLSNYLAETNFTDAPISYMVALVYNGLAAIYQPIGNMLENISPGKDAFTYPLLLLLFIYSVYLLATATKKRPRHQQALFAFMLSYAFYWLVLSAGIVWYGFLIFPVLTALALLGIQKQGESTSKYERWISKGSAVLVGFSILIGVSQRFSNIQLKLGGKDPLVGKRMYDPAYVKFQLGDLDKNGVIGEYFRNLPKAIKEINSENKSLVYNVGTRFTFFIDNNDARVFKDNQLQFFKNILEKYKRKTAVTDLLRRAGFKYIMVDLNTPSGDKTPEQTLVERYKKFMLLLYQNPEMELVSTDRVVQSEDGQQNVYNIFGKVVSTGTYAIFKIK